MRSWHLLLASVLLSAGVSALADDTERRPPERDPAQVFAQLDQNANGEVERSEIPEGQVRFFERLVRIGDKNADGKLSHDEFVAAMNQPEARATSPMPGGPPGPGGGPGRGEFNPGEIFNRLDRNGDGTLTRDELPEPAQDRFGPLFERLGKEGLTRDDFVRSMAQFGEGGRGRPGDGRMRAEMLARLREMDRNKDGKVTLDEAPPEAHPRIQEMLNRMGTDAIDLDRFARMVEEGGPGERPRDGDRPPMGREEDRPPMGRDGERPRPEGPGEGRGPREGFGPPRGEGDRPPMGRDGEGPGRGEMGRFGFAPRFFRELDRNRDGRLNRKEVMELAEQFSEFDGNGDGELDLFELLGPRPGDEGRPPFGRPDGGGPPRDGFRPPREGDRPNFEREGGPRGERPQPNPGEGERPARPRPERDDN